MSAEVNPLRPSPGGQIAQGLDRLRANWGWYLALGIAMVVLGFFALTTPLFASLTVALFVGWLMLIAGVFEIAHAFNTRGWGGFFIDLLMGILYLVTGLYVLANPLPATLTITLVVAAFLTVGGVFRVIAALSTRYHHWGWLLLNGVIDIVLGLMIFAKWPSSGLWVLGLFLGIDLIFNGWALVMLGMAAHNLPHAEPARTNA